MKRFSSLILILSIAFLLDGCRNGPTSPNNINSAGWIEATSKAPWSARYGLTGAVFNGNMWIMGGASGSGSTTIYDGDVWKSGNGSSWTQTATPFSGGRYGGQAVSFNNDLYFIGGNDNGTLMNDVWSSSDGVNWTQILADNPGINSNVVGGTQFCPREDFNAVVFNNLIWVIGGTPDAANTISVGLNDVWSSPDGKTWTQVLANAPNITLGTATTQPPPRWGAAAVSFNGNIYLMCGHDSGFGDNSVASDIWSSANGSTWTYLGSNFGPVYFHQLVDNDNLMWFTCGYAPWDGGAFALVDSSSNWTSWTSPGTVPLTGRFGHLSLAFNQEVWIMGGCNNTNSLTYFNDVWHSP